MQNTFSNPNARYQHRKWSACLPVQVLTVFCSTGWQAGHVTCDRLVSTHRHYSLCITLHEYLKAHFHFLSRKEYLLLGLYGHRCYMFHRVTGPALNVHGRLAPHAVFTVAVAKGRVHVRYRAVLSVLCAILVP